MNKALVCCIAAGALLQLTACSLSSIPIDVMRPADIFVPQEIKSVAVANRSIAGKGHKFTNAVEGLFSGEGIGVDREGSHHCVQGLVDMLQTSPRYSAVNASSEELEGVGGDGWNTPLEWGKVQEVCEEFKTDALITLAIFDSDARTSVGAAIEKTRKVEGVTETYYEYPAYLEMDITAGWRIYHPKTETIVDQNRFTDSQSFQAIGSSVGDAESSLPNQRRATREAGAYAGSQYGYRISPMWVEARRQFFVKGHDDFKLARVVVKTGDWAQAAELYHPITKDPVEKVRARACFNMALSCEMQDDLEGAVQWINKASDLGLSHAKAYHAVLIQRQADARRLDKQLPAEE